MASLKPIQLQAASLLAAGRSVEDTAQQLAIHRTTVCRWRAAPAFAAEVNRLSGEMQQQIAAALRELQSDALVVLRDAMTGTAGYTPAEKVRVAMWLLESTGAAKAAGRIGPQTVDGIEAAQTARLIAELAG